MTEVCKHHEAIEQCAGAAKAIAIGNSKEIKTKISVTLFLWIVGGIAGLLLVLLSIVDAKVQENSRLFHHIDKNIAVIANSVGCEDKLERYSGD